MKLNGVESCYALQLFKVNRWSLIYCVVDNNVRVGGRIITTYTSRYASDFQIKFFWIDIYRIQLRAR